jgi:hypothetical protein
MKCVGCKNCNRILWEKDADKNGLCVDCRPSKRTDDLQHVGQDDGSTTEERLLSKIKRKKEDD